MKGRIPSKKDGDAGDCVLTRRAEELAIWGDRLRAQCAELAFSAGELRGKCKENLSQPVPVPFDKAGEVAANLTLAIRHFEDAEARVARALKLMELE